MQTSESIKILLKNIFHLSEEEFLSYNKISTSHVQSYFNQSMDEKFQEIYTYLDHIKDNLDEYCEFGADKCKISNFKDFCESLDIDIIDNLSRIIKEYYHLFLANIRKRTPYHFYNRDKTFMFTCTSPLYMDGSLGYFGCTGEQKYVLKAFEMVHNDGNEDLCYGRRDYA